MAFGRRNLTSNLLCLLGVRFDPHGTRLGSLSNQLSNLKQWVTVSLEGSNSAQFVTRGGGEAVGNHRLSHIS